jgi:hydrogenase/urease accessory protein HupE
MDGLTPIAPLRPVRMRVGTWAALALISLAAVAWTIGLRRDVPTAEPTLAVQVIIMGLLAGIGATAALRLAVPGADRLSARMWVLGVLGLWPCGLVVRSHCTSHA